MRRGATPPTGARRILPVVLLIAVLGGAPLAGQQWTGFVEVALIGQSESSGSSAGSFRSQHNLDEGFLLDALELRWADEETPQDFELRAWGFGDAEPAEGADIRWRFAAPWELDVEYRRNESFFALAESDLGLREDDWEITRFKATVRYDGWRPAKLSLRVGHVERSGKISQPFRQFNDVYLLGVDLDETRQEFGFRIETRTLPVKLTFEQSYAELERDNAWFAASELPVSGLDVNRLVDADNSLDEKREIPVSRLTAAWANDRVAVTGAMLYSPGDLDTSGETSVGIALNGGNVGTAGFATSLLGAASFDAFAGHLGVDVRLADHWTLRLVGDHHDRAQDATLSGSRILRAISPLGDVFEIPQVLDDSTAFDVTDTDVRAELEYDHGRWSAWGGFSDGNREVSYRGGGRNGLDAPDGADDGFAVDNDREGVVLGFGLDLSSKVDLTVEYEQNDFEDVVFRVDPKTVDRVSIKLRAALTKTLQLRLRGRFENGDNPVPGAELDRSSESAGIGLFWMPESGKHDVGIDLDTTDVTSETGLLLPGGAPGLSLYDLSLTTWTIHGRSQLSSKLNLSGHAYMIEDSGETWPFDAWSARVRLGVQAIEHAEVAVFGEYWSYDEDFAQGDDFDVTRYGVAFVWRFE